MVKKLTISDDDEITDNESIMEEEEEVKKKEVKQRPKKVMTQRQLETLNQQIILVIVTENTRNFSQMPLPFGKYRDFQLNMNEQSNLLNLLFSFSRS